MAQLTRKAITQSFLKLLSEKPLEKISVKDIVDDCGITRNAFYYHFEDIYSVADEIISGVTDDILADENRAQKWDELFAKTIAFFKDNKKLVQHVYHSKRRSEISKYFNNAAEKLAKQFVEDLSAGINASSEDKDLVSRLYCYAVQGMFMNLMEGRIERPVEGVISRITELFKGATETALIISEKENRKKE